MSSFWRRKAALEKRLTVSWTVYRQSPYVRKNCTKTDSGLLTDHMSVEFAEGAAAA